MSELLSLFTSEINISSVQQGLFVYILMIIELQGLFVYILMIIELQGLFVYILMIIELQGILYKSFLCELLYM